MLEIGVRLHLNEKPESSILASASVTLNGQFAISSISVRNGQYGKYITMPSMLVGENDGKKIYEPVCYAWNSQSKKNIQNRVLEAYERALSSTDGKYYDEEIKPQELPFEVAVEPVSGSPSILAKVSVNFGREIVIEGIRIKQTWKDHRQFVTMPQYPSKDGKWKDYCCPITKEYRELFSKGILAAYEKELQLQNQAKRSTADTPPKASL